MRFPGFVGAAYNLPNRRIDCQRCINLFLEKTESGAGREGEPASLRRTPGLLAFLTLPGGATRGGYRGSDGQMFAVGGNKLYSLAPNGAYTELGTLNTSAGRVSMADNGIQLVVVDGSETLYVWTFNTTTFSTKGSEDNYEASHLVDFQDGYFIFSTTEKFYISDLYSVDLDPLDISGSEGSPDAIVGHIVANRSLWVFNEYSTEVFFNAGDADFPFKRIEGAFISIGCAARHSIARIGNAVCWIGKDESGEGIVYMAEGLSPRRISTHAIEQAIQRYATVSDAVGYCYQQDGHGFYALNFPGANTTWVFDLATGLWHERAHAADGQLGRHRASWHAYAFGKHLVGDYENGKVYELSMSAKSDDGAPIIRRRIAPHASAGGKLVSCHSFELDIEMGVGIDGAGQGEDPQAMLRISKDGGYTWGNELWRSFGRIGERQKRAIWRRLGQSRDWVFEISISDPVDVAVLGAEIELERKAA